MLCAVEKFNAEDAGQGVECRLLDEQSLRGISPGLVRLCALYQKADTLALRNRDRYMGIVRILSIFGVGLVVAFLMYDEMNALLFLLAYGVILTLAFVCFALSRKGAYHEKYLEYRVLAETLRVQFYLLASGVNYDVSHSFTWSHKMEVGWVARSLSVLLVSVEAQELDAAKVRYAWVDSQLIYHQDRQKIVAVKNRLNTGITVCALVFSVALFVAVLILELGIQDTLSTAFSAQNVRGVLMMRVGEVSLRDISKILMGAASAVTMFLANYYGKLSLERKQVDHEKMAELYAVAGQKLDEPGADRKAVMLRLAKEEVAENGVWLSYCRGNAPVVNL